MSRSGPLLYICDWLPPDFGAVGQYSQLFARQMAEDGREVTLAGLSSHAASDDEETIGAGRLRTIRLHAPAYAKERFLARIWWTCVVNTRLILALLPVMRRSEEIVFTGSPPLFLHWIVPLNLILRKTLTYRITDFHPECLMAARETPSLPLNLLYRLTVFWRHRVTRFEALGNDQCRRLAEIGIPPERISLKRDPSPVEITAATEPLPRPEGFEDKILLLYSGNWGVAHDIDTFVEGYRRHHREGSGRVVLWLNAVGAAAGQVEAKLVAEGLPLYRSKPVPIADLASLLVTPDAHLITLRDRFVGFVLPSKVYGCIASKLPILYVGSDQSDVHTLCVQSSVANYQRVAIDDFNGVQAALELIANSRETR